jgi:transposase
VGLQVIRDWVLKFNVHGPDGLIDRKAPGQRPRLNEQHRAALAATLESGPIPAVHGVVRWRIVDLCKWMFEEFRIVVSKQTLSRVLRKLGYRNLSARPRHHAQAAGAIEDFKKGDCHIATGRARSVGGSGIVRLLRRRSAMCPSPQREARGAFGLR